MGAGPDFWRTLPLLVEPKIDGTGLPSVDVGNSATLQVGQNAIAIGGGGILGCLPVSDLRVGQGEQGGDAAVP